MYVNIKVLLFFLTICVYMTGFKIVSKVFVTFTLFYEVNQFKVQLNFYCGKNSHVFKYFFGNTKFYILAEIFRFS